MGDSKPTQILNSGDKLLEEPTSFLFLQSILRSDIIKELTVTAMFHDQKNPLRCLYDFIDLDDVRVLHYFQNMNFSGNSFDVVNVVDLLFI